MSLNKYEDSIINIKYYLFSIKYSLHEKNFFEKKNSNISTNNNISVKRAKVLEWYLDF
jgi:hypothetical protein